MFRGQRIGNIIEVQESFNTLKIYLCVSLMARRLTVNVKISVR